MLRFLLLMPLLASCSAVENGVGLMAASIVPSVNVPTPDATFPVNPSTMESVNPSTMESVNPIDLESVAAPSVNTAMPAATNWLQGSIINLCEKCRPGNLQSSASRAFLRRFLRVLLTEANTDPFIAVSNKMDAQKTNRRLVTRKQRKGVGLGKDDTNADTDSSGLAVDNFGPVNDNFGVMISPGNTNGDLDNYDNDNDNNNNNGGNNNPLLLIGDHNIVLYAPVVENTNLNSNRNWNNHWHPEIANTRSQTNEPTKSAD